MPLTWQNVAAPDFSGAMLAQKMAGEQLNTGFGALSDALAVFQKNKIDAANNAGLEQSRQLADENARLSNAGLTEDNSQKAWLNGKTKEFEAGRSEAVKLANEAGYWNSLGTPEGRTKALDIVRNGSSVLANNGFDVAKINTMLAGNTAQSVAGLESNKAYIDFGDNQTDKARTKEAQALFGEKFTTAGTYEDVVAALQKSNKDPRVLAQALALAEQNKPLFAGPADSADVILRERIAAEQGKQNTTQRIVYQNQNSTRNDPLADDVTKGLTPLLDEFNLTSKVFSGGQETREEVEAGKGARTGKEGHDHGGAGDMEFYAADGHKLVPNNPADKAILQALAKRSMDIGLGRWGEGEDYMGTGRIHVGRGTPAIWGKSNSRDTAPDWLREVYDGKVTGRIDQAFDASRDGQIPQQDLTAPNSDQVTTSIDRAAAASEKAMSMADVNQSLVDRSLGMRSQSQRLVDTINTDNALDPYGSLTNTLTSRPEKNTPATEMAKKLSEELGGKGTKEGTFDGELTLPQITDVINTISARHGNLPADVVAAFVREGIQQNTFGFRGLFGQRSADIDKIDNMIGQFFDPSGKPTGLMEGALGRMGTLRSKENNIGLIKKMEQDVQKAETAYFTALKRKESGRSGVDVESKLLMYKAMQAKWAKLNDQISRDPSTQANAKSKLPIE